MIKAEFLEIAKASPSCRADLQEVLKRSYSTIDKYLKDNDIMLTTLASLLVIKELTGVTDLFDLVEKIPMPARKVAALPTN